MCERHSDTTLGDTAAAAFRLPRHVWPRKQRIKLDLDTVGSTFKGEQTITIDVKSSTSEIQLNAKELDIHEVHIENQKGTTITGSALVNAQTELATLTFPATISKGRWKLHVKWSGKIREELDGCYRSYWVDKDKKKHLIVSTQFEATHARKCIPCFDEPEFKAKYQLELILPAHMTALSNTRVQSETIIDDGIRFIRAPGNEQEQRKHVVFKKMPVPMSTYLLTFACGPFVRGKSAWVGGTEVVIWTFPGMEHMTDYALECACDALAFFEKEHGCKFYLDQLNHIPIPQFKAGAMEHPGAITYRMTDVLIDLLTATIAEKKRVRKVITHETGHMDDGNRVTMPWWSDLPQQEATATFDELWCTHHMEPSWKVLDEFSISRAGAMDIDSLNTTHPAYSQVDTPEQAEELFDAISYEKGCAMFFMAQQFIGEEVFRQGKAAVYKRFEWGCASLSDRWDLLEETCKANKVDFPARRVMDAWFNQAGHPVVSVTPTGTKFVTLAQKPFKYLANGEDQTIWPIPVTMRIVHKDGSSQTQKFLMEGKEELRYLGEYDYVVVNADGFGVYRVGYTPELLAKLSAHLGDLSVVERFNLVNDSWAQVIAGLLSAADYWKMLEPFKNEMSPYVQRAMIGSYSRLNGLLEGSARTAFAAKVRSMAAPIAKQLGWKPAEDETPQMTELRGSVLSVLGTIGGDKEIVAEAAKQFESWKKDRQSVLPDLLPAIVSILAYNGDKARYDEFFAIFKAKTTPQEEKRFLLALASFRNPELLDKTLEHCFSDHVGKQDCATVLSRLLSNEISAEKTWDHARANWDKVVSHCTDSGVVGITEILGSFDTPDIESEVTEFLAKTKIQSGEKAAARAVEWLRINVQLRDRESKALTEHLVPTPPPAKRDEAAKEGKPAGAEKK